MASITHTIHLSGTVLGEMASLINVDYIIWLATLPAVTVVIVDEGKGNSVRPI